jgi:hypothetical protein
MGLIDKISARIELFRLEQRYTKRRNRRSTFFSDAIYVDGEYIYQNPSPTKRHSIVPFSSSEESVSVEDIHGIQAYYERMEREAAMRAQRGMTETEGREGREGDFGEYGLLRARGGGPQQGKRGEREHMDGMGPMPGLGSQGDATRSKRRWGAGPSVRTTSKRRSMMTVQEVRWEEGRR